MGTGYRENALIDPSAYDSPAGLSLEQVHVYVRHGERTPVGNRMTSPPASIPEFWPFCRVARQFNAAVLGHGHARETQELLRVTERKDGTSVDGECMLGELTDLGRQSTLGIGTALHDIYVKRLNFLPDAIDATTGIIYLRSTAFPRTIESLQQVLHGIYPTGKFLNGSVPRIRVRHPIDENLMGNNACARFKELMAGFERAAAEKYNPLLTTLDGRLSRYIGGNPVRIDGKPRASGILDTIRAAVSHDVKVPAEFKDPEIMRPIEEAVVAEWFDGYKNDEVRRLAVGRLLEELSSRMASKASKGNADPLKIAINACHDTSLAGLSQTLDVFDGRWPHFTASITFELFKGTPTAPKGVFQKFFGSSEPAPHYVRMRYGNRSLKLPLCAAPGRHLLGSPEFCTLEAFSKRATELAPIDWESECQATTTSKAKLKITKAADAAVVTQQIVPAKVVVKEI
ncbi:hypothetical protein BS47DRAFT_1371232 [Hydnum rufescens UP504]|uniref:Phosphoglycerate mutase-like protein n=1 Tax=Hydnum rufescens UP504 TaxID=1448309 RepID=A0A9P6B521_9AGAM|nr:hypothetical protein BS47DRAFT_1371232 [Hydnum rufescens UP504]